MCAVKFWIIVCLSAATTASVIGTKMTDTVTPRRHEKDTITIPSLLKDRGLLERGKGRTTTDQESRAAALALGSAGNSRRERSCGRLHRIGAVATRRGKQIKDGLAGPRGRGGNGIVNRSLVTDHRGADPLLPYLAASGSPGWGREWRPVSARRPKLRSSPTVSTGSRHRHPSPDRATRSEASRNRSPARLGGE